MPDIITVIIFLIVGVILIAQAIFGIVYLYSIPIDFYNTLSKGDNRALKTSLNISILLGGFGLGIIANSLELLLPFLKNILTFVLLYFGVTAVFIAVIYFIPGYVSIDKITNVQLRDIDTVSIISYATIGFLIAFGTTNFIEQSFKAIEVPLISIAIQLIVGSVLVLVQSAALFVSYYFGNRSRNFLLYYGIFAVLGAAGVGGGVIILATG